MSDRDRINRRDFIVTTAGVAGSASALADATLTRRQAQARLAASWVRRISRRSPKLGASRCARSCRST